MIGLNSNRSKILGLLCLLLFWGTGICMASESPFVLIYDDISDTYYGRSEKRSVLRGVRLDSFNLFRTLGVDVSHLDVEREEGFLTPLVFDQTKKERLDRGEFPQITLSRGIYTFRQGGIDFSFTLEKPPAKLLEEIDRYYSDWPEWKEPVREHYLGNWVIRIHRAENVFEPWIDLITYNEALLSASIIADSDQWLWGVKDGLDLLLSQEQIP